MFGQAGGEVAGIIAAIAALITAVFGALWKVLQTYDGRTDKATAESMKTLRERATSAERERDRARAGEARAYEERDRWMERAQAAELTIARMGPTPGPTGDSP